MAVWPHRLGPGPWNWGRYGVPACQPAGQQKQFCPGPVSAPARPAFPGAHVPLTVRPGGPRLPGSYLTTSVLLFTPTRGPAGSVQDWKWVCPAERVRSFCRKGRYFCRVALKCRFPITGSPRESGAAQMGRGREGRSCCCLELLARLVCGF